MYCPRCGVQTSLGDIKFCRACGADLTLVSQAMAGQISWRTHLLTRLDNFFLSRREYEDRESAREGGWNIFLGTALLTISIWSLVAGEGGPALWIVLLLFSLVSLKIGVGNMRLHRRYLQGNSPPEIRPGKNDLSLLKLSSPPSQAAPSVTEKTTELFDADRGKTK